VNRKVTVPAGNGLFTPDSTTGLDTEA
jgi:hypothetical protein